MFSEKQLRVLRWPYREPEKRALICDGADKSRGIQKQLF